MLGLSNLLTTLGTSVIPKVLESAAPDTLFQIRRSKADDGGGSFSQTPSATTSVAIPCVYQAREVTEEIEGGGGFVSHTEYSVTIPAYWRGEALTVEAGDRLEIQARAPLGQIALEVEGWKSLAGAAFEIKGRLASE
jgi:hypothetical protein